MIHALLLCVAALATGEPTVVLSGTVVDAGGQPVPGAMVVVAEGGPALRLMVRTAPIAPPRAPNVLATGASDDLGKFSIALPEEAPEVPWRRTRLTVWAYHGDAALAVRLIDRDWPRAGLPLAIRMPAVAQVRLKITDESFRSVADARITPLRVAGHLVPDVLANQLAADTDGRGRATLSGVVPAELDTVRVENQAIGVQWVGLPAGRDKIVLLSLSPVGRLIGRLTADDPRATARRTLRFATWQIPGDEHAGGGLAEAVADDEGKFDVPAIAAGSLALKVGEGPEPSATQNQEAAPVYLSAQTTGPAVEGRTTTTFDIPLRRAVQVVQEVRDQDSGAPVAGVRVSMNRLPLAVSGDTDAAGRLRVDVLPGVVSPSPVRIPPPYFNPNGTRNGGAEVGESTQVVSLKAIEFARGVSVRGRVVDDKRRPLAGAEVAGLWKAPASNQNLQLHAWSDADGEFAIDAVAPQTTVLLWARHGESLSIQPVSAQPGGEPVTLTVGKEPGVSLEGRVVDDAGQPIAAAVVRVWARQVQAALRQPGEELGYVLFDGNDRLFTDADGRFHTPTPLRPNAGYSLEVTAPGMWPSETETIEPDSWHTTRFADVVLRPAPRLRTVGGRVVDRQGRPVAGAGVWQSGDGPRRTQTTTDDDGRFQLGGIYDGPAFLFARKDGFRLQGARIAPMEKTCQITLRRGDEPAAVMATLPPALSLDEQRELAMSLLEPLLPMLRDPVLSLDHLDLLRIVARVDPPRALELADTLAHGEYALATRLAAARSLLSTDFDQGLAVVARLDQPSYRAQTCMFSFDEQPDAPRERRDRLLDEALVHARVDANVGLKAWELGQIGVRWLDLGERERGVALLREGQVLAEALPAPNEANLRQSISRGVFAGLLARIDGPAALRLMEGFGESDLDRFRADVARGLADHDPVEAERLFPLIQSPTHWFRMRLAPLARMAATDAERAARLARTFTDLCERGFALGTVAYALADKDRDASSELLEEAYAVLDRAAQLGPTQSGRRDAALTAAALLPVAEKIDATLVEGYFWRALSLREPWPSPSDSAPAHDFRLSELAAMIARYDRAVARDLLTPLAGRLRIPGTIMIGLALTDPRWAAELIQALGDFPAPPAKDPKLIAARHLAEWLARPARGSQGTWQTVYGSCNLRDPDTVEEIR